MSELAEKERRAIKILRMHRGDEPIEVSYSGGKDSDVILQGFIQRYNLFSSSAPARLEACKHRQRN